MDRSVSSSVEEGPVYTHQTMRLEEGMALECGAHLAPLEVAYCTTVRCLLPAITPSLSVMR